MKKPTLLVLTSSLLLFGCNGATKEIDVPPARNGLAQPETLAWWSRAAIDALQRLERLALGLYCVVRPRGSSDLQ